MIFSIIQLNIADINILCIYSHTHTYIYMYVCMYMYMYSLYVLLYLDRGCMVLNGMFCDVAGCNGMQWDVHRQSVLQACASQPNDSGQFKVLRGW